jgi:phage terminase large subunit-like protein
MHHFNLPDCQTSRQLPIAEVEAYVRDLRRDYDVREVAYDPAFITWSAATLEAEGIPMVEFPQTDSRMVPATGVTFELAVNGRLQHVEDDDAPLFERHVRQTAVANSRGGGQRVAKGKTRAPMDGSVALVMAVYRAVKSLLDDSGGVPMLWIPGE